MFAAAMGARGREGAPGWVDADIHRQAGYTEGLGGKTSRCRDAAKIAHAKLLFLCRHGRSIPLKRAIHDQ